MRRLSLLSAVAGGTLPICGVFAQGICDPEWTDLNGGIQLGFLPIVYQSLPWDDGNSEELYVCGIFELAGGSLPVRNIAKWNGSRWADVGGGVTRGTASAIVVCVTSHDDGSGDALYIGGLFTLAGSTPNTTYIARWDGSQWSSVGGGMNGNVWDLAEWDDDGAGPNPPKLYASGEFTLAGGIPASRAAVWDGSTWTALGTGLEFGSQTFLAGYTLEPIDRGVLFGGIFGLAGGLPVRGLALWNGADWETLGPELENPGFNTSVGDIIVFDGGEGPQVHVTGSFISSQGTTLDRIARFDGAAWRPLATGLQGGGSSFAIWDGVGGTSLWVGGTFTSAGGGASPKLARWDGSKWNDVGMGLAGGGPIVEAAAITPWNDGLGDALYVGGYFTTAGTRPVNSIARLAACEVLCYPDCDTQTGPGVLDIFDFLCFGNRFSFGDPYACDCDTTTGPGLCDIFDFLCFGNAFNAGCP
jgi:hypothetical protein